MIRESIWELIYDHIDERSHDDIKRVKYEDNIQEIIDSVQSLASCIEDDIKEDWRQRNDRT